MTSKVVPTTLLVWDESNSDDQPNEYRGKITFDGSSSTSELLENLQKMKSEES
ncbi:DUF5786 family protein [Halostagnicola sp. A56]|uniref:DUF5786 family protein n=1 Tax=Halostagnicola sp. A56 TaxID=1495067 RepID=UPI001E5DAB08|nr:DUF5786 family protein [Halostagnicola sp. A56]